MSNANFVASGIKIEKNSRLLSESENLADEKCSDNKKKSIVALVKKLKL